MADIVSDYGVSATGHRQFQEKLVARVRKEWTNPEVDAHLPACETESLHNGVDRGRRNPKCLRFTFADRFVLEDERHRDQWLPGFADLSENGERRPTPGSQGGNDD